MNGLCEVNNCVKKERKSESVKGKFMYGIWIGKCLGTPFFVAFACLFALVADVGVFFCWMLSFLG